MGQAKKSIVKMNPDLISAEAWDFENDLRSRIIGQDRAVRTVARALQVWRAGLCPMGRPIANFLFLGPTGVGKTHLVEALAEITVGTPEAVIKIDCAEFKKSHEVAKLLGSPPGYVGAERVPRITNEKLERYHNKYNKISFVLFDEIEKAHEDLFELLLGVTDKAKLTLGDGKDVDFSRSMIFLTSNLVAREMSEMVGGGLGFGSGLIHEDDLDMKIYKTAMKAASRHFSPEFMNRIDRTVVFHSLQSHHLEEILDVELKKVQDRITMQAAWEKYFILKCYPSARQFLLREGTDQRYGARPLKRAIERHVMVPISNLLTTNQIDLGDVVTVDCNANGELEFVNEVAGALIEKHEDSFPLMKWEEQQ
ncbi:MAG: AAA family ATPase [Patescibacteria group bacterium]